jgi:hypothetical protein
MTESPLPANHKYRFENDVSGQLFSWLVGCAPVDSTILMDRALRKDASREKAVKRLAEAVRVIVAVFPNWASRWQNRNLGEAADPDRLRNVPPYSIWYRPSPNKKIRFLEVAEAWLVFAGRLPANVGGEGSGD